MVNQKLVSLLLAVFLFIGQVQIVYAAGDAQNNFSLGESSASISNTGEKNTVEERSLVPLGDSSTTFPCTTPSQLLELVSQNEGGTVKLTGDIIWDTYDALEVTYPTTIDLGSYSISVSGCTFNADGPLLFTGDGTNAPLFQVDRVGELYLNGISITANGDGATAVSVENGYSLQGYNNSIKAIGSNATAVSCLSDLNMRMVKVDADGAGSVAIQADGDVSLFFCNISGVIEAKGDIGLDYTKAEPMSEKAKIINSVMVANYERYGYVKDPQYNFFESDSMMFSLYNRDDISNGYPLPYDYFLLPVRFDISGYDPDTPGTYPISYSVVSDLLDMNFSGSVPLHVTDPNLPWLSGASWTLEEKVFLDLDCLLNDADDVQVLYSDDIGQSWKNAATDFKVYIYSSEVYILGLDIEEIYWFRIVVNGGEVAGTSNIIKVWYDPTSDGGPNPQDNRQLPIDGPASEPDGPVMTSEEFLAQLAENDGGEVTLTGNVVLQAWCIVEVTNPTTVQMGDFTITVLGYSAKTHIQGPLNFVGNGDKRPLFQVKNRGELIFSGDATVTATGEGGVAILGDGDVYLEQPEIYAPNGTAVHSKGMAILFYGYVSGRTAVVSDTNKILLESTVTIPKPAKAKIVEQAVIPILNNYELDRYGISVEQGDEYFLDDFSDIVYYYFFDKSNPSMDRSTTLIKPVEWKLAEGFDVNISGEYAISMVPKLSDQRMDVSGLQQMEIPLFVVDPYQPWLVDAVHNVYGETTIHYFKAIKNAESMTLRYSTDFGETWQDAGANLGFSADYEYNANLILPDYEEDTVYWFQLEVTGGEMAGVSNILKVWYSPYDNSGGDRTGADRFPDFSSDEPDEPGTSGGKPPRGDGSSSGHGGSDNYLGNGNIANNRSNHTNPITPVISDELVGEPVSVQVKLSDEIINPTATEYVGMTDTDSVINSEQSPPTLEVVPDQSDSNPISELPSAQVEQKSYSSSGGAANWVPLIAGTALLSAVVYLFMRIRYKERV